MKTTISEPELPADLRQALAADASAEAAWQSLTPVGRRDFLLWLDSAKQGQTRSRRIVKACSMLVSGKRRPCCFAVVPMNLYRALDADPAAKAGWRQLTPMGRRDVVSWIDAAADAQAQRRRMDEACAKLATGQKLPS